MALRLKQSISLSSRNTTTAVGGLVLLLPCSSAVTTSSVKNITTRRSSQWAPLRPTKRLQSSFTPAAADLHDHQDIRQNVHHAFTNNHGRRNAYEEYQQPREISHGDVAAEDRPPLSLLRMSSVLRSLAVNTISSSPFLLHPSLTVMAMLANSKSAILSPDRNPLLNWLLKRTFYAQYCGGENAPELQTTVSGLKEMGYEGVILVYAKEVEIDHKDEQTGVEVPVEEVRVEATPETLADIETWKNGTLETVRLAERGDMVALKYVSCTRSSSLSTH